MLCATGLFVLGEGSAKTNRKSCCWQWGPTSRRKGKTGRFVYTFLYIVLPCTLDTYFSLSASIYSAWSHHFPFLSVNLFSWLQIRLRTRGLSWLVHLTTLESLLLHIKVDLVQSRGSSAGKWRHKLEIKLDKVRRQLDRNPKLLNWLNQEEKFLCEDLANLSRIYLCSSIT